MKYKAVNVFKYNLKRNRNNYRFTALLSFAVMFFLLMFASTIQNSFEQEYIRHVKEKYPMDTFCLQKESFDQFIYKDECGVYDYYTATEEEVTALYLAKKEHSVLAIEGMLEYGKFPEDKNEVIVSRDLLVNKYEVYEDFEKWIDKKIIFMDKEFVISGILHSFDENSASLEKNENFEYYMNDDVYYFRVEGNLIFIPYDTIKTFLQPQDKLYGSYENATIMIRAYYPNLLDNEQVMGELKKLRSGYINVFTGEIDNAQDTFDSISIMLIIIFFVCYIISCLFMSSQIQIELFYRRKELGYLQIFGVKKRRIIAVVLSGYAIKIGLSLIMATVLYWIIIGGYYLLFNSFIIYNLVHMFTMIMCILAFYFTTVFFSTVRFLKKDIINLIVE